MDLSLKDRVILANQCRILERLYPEEADAYARYRVALERGYEYDYGNPPGSYTNEMRSNQSEEVIEILDMHRRLRFAYDDLEDKSGIDEQDIAFEGFDGNNEGKYLGYARYICFEQDDKYVVNSHWPKVGVYRRMMEEWNRSADKYNLTKEDIRRIIAAKTHPSNK